MPSGNPAPPSLNLPGLFTPRYAEVQGLRLHYWDEGAGVPVVMVHGNPTWCFLYGRLTRTLIPRFRVLVPDHIGCGLSDRPGESEYPFTLERRIQDFSDFLDKAGIAEPFHLVVHDWGGLIGLGHAVRHPEMIRSLVVFNTAAFHIPPGEKLHWTLRWCRRSGIAAWAMSALGAFNRIAVRAGSGPGLEPGIRRGLMAPYRTRRDRLAVVKFVQDIPLEPGHPSYATVSGIEAGLAQLSEKPVLICWGDRDFIFDTRFLMRWLHFFPHARVHRMANGGHYVMEDAHDTVLLQVEDFLQEN